MPTPDVNYDMRVEAAANLSPVAHSIFKNVLRAMQDAEEIGGPEGHDYHNLMGAIMAEAKQRLGAYRF